MGEWWDFKSKYLLSASGEFGVKWGQILHSFSNICTYFELMKIKIPRISGWKMKFRQSFFIIANFVVFLRNDDFWSELV